VGTPASIGLRILEGVDGDCDQGLFCVLGSCHDTLGTCSEVLLYP
jgi:hypothetical protein